MKISCAAIAIALSLCASSLQAQSVAEQALAASNDLQSAIADLQKAQSSKDRVASLTRTIRAYETGLAAVRAALRQAHLRQTTLEMQFESKRERVAQLVGVLGQMERSPGPLLLLHPSGPLGTVRSGMILADVTPALVAEAEQLREELAELRDLHSTRKEATQILGSGLGQAQQARMILSQAISERSSLPKRFTEDAETLNGLLDSAATLEDFTAGLELDEQEDHDFASAKGKLDLPVLGNRLRRAMEADPAGVRRPGVTLATRPRALVTAPWPATIRYIGPLLDYGNVIVLEPGGGYLLILAGLDTVYGSVGEVVGPAAAIGLMGGGEPGVVDFLAASQEGGGVQGTQTLYMELRQGAEPVDPAEWFTALRE